MFGEIFAGVLLLEAILILFGVILTKKIEDWWVPFLIFNLVIIIILGLVIGVYMIIYLIRMF